MDTEPARLRAVAAAGSRRVDPEDDDDSLSGAPTGDASLAVERRIAVSAILTGRAGFEAPSTSNPVSRAWEAGTIQTTPTGTTPTGTTPTRTTPKARTTWIRGLSAALLGRRSAAARVPAAAPLLDVFRRQHPGADAELELLRRSYRVAEFLHGDQRRRSGTPYIGHPLAVATILAELGMDASTLVAALLHDAVEDTDYTLGECRVDFGAEVARLVDGVTKLDGERLGKDVAERETFRKMVLAAGVDLRVLLI